MNNPPKIFAGQRAACKFPVDVTIDFQDTGGQATRLTINAVFEVRVDELSPGVEEDSVKHALRLGQPGEIKRRPQDVCAQLASRIQAIFTPTLLNSVVPNGFFEDSEIDVPNLRNKILDRYRWHWRKYQQDEVNPLPETQSEREAISAWRHDDETGTVWIMLEPNPEEKTTTAWERRSSAPWKQYTVQLDFTKAVTLVNGKKPAFLEDIFRGKIIDQVPKTRAPRRKKPTHKRK
ncbi:MAG: hypothetical protein WAP74_02945 [Patescibacteria group bacterium]